MYRMGTSLSALPRFPDNPFEKMTISCRRAESTAGGYDLRMKKSQEITRKNSFHDSIRITVDFFRSAKSYMRHFFVRDSDAPSPHCVPSTFQGCECTYDVIDKRTDVRRMPVPAPPLLFKVMFPSILPDRLRASSAIVWSHAISRGPFSILYLP